MIRFILNLIIISIFSFSIYANGTQLADKNELNIQEQIKNKYQGCYEIDKYMDQCSRFTCTKPYPYQNGAWETFSIIGLRDNKCYIINYTFIGREIINHPRHCLLDNQELKEYLYYLSIIKNENINITNVNEAEAKINNLLSKICIVRSIPKKEIREEK